MMGFAGKRLAVVAALAVSLTLSCAGAALCEDEGGEEAERHHHDDSRAERALSGRQSGELKPVAELMAKVLAKFGGRIVETEFEEHDGRQVYEFYVLGEDGVIREVYVDAASGAIVKVHGAD